jgi:hypothetical protein
VAPYSEIIGSALGSIIAVIMTPQPTTKARPSATVAGIGIVIIMAPPCRLDRTTDTQAAAAMSNRTTEVRTVIRSRTGTGSSLGPTTPAGPLMGAARR